MLLCSQFTYGLYIFIHIYIPHVHLVLAFYLVAPVFYLMALIQHLWRLWHFNLRPSCIITWPLYFTFVAITFDLAPSSRNCSLLELPFCPLAQMSDLVTLMYHLTTLIFSRSYDVSSLFLSSVFKILPHSLGVLSPDSVNHLLATWWCSLMTSIFIHVFWTLVSSVFYHHASLA